MGVNDVQVSGKVKQHLELVSEPFQNKVVTERRVAASDI
jgi:hypothetical protein